MAWVSAARGLPFRLRGFPHEAHVKMVGGAITACFLLSGYALFPLWRCLDRRRLGSHQERLGDV